MKAKLNTYFYFGTLLYLACLVVFSVWARLKNIDMTETRLFITYWKEYTVLIVFALAAGIGYKVTEK